MNQTFNIFANLNKAITNFDNNTVNVIPADNHQNTERRYLGGGHNGYEFSQRELLIDIDMAYNSVYKNGRYDAQGQRKTYLNIVRFYTQVAIKNTDIDTKNFVFTPSDYSKENIWGVWFFKRQFSNWIKQSEFGKTINDLLYDFNKYGSAVAKKTKNNITRVPLRSIRCDQSAATLLEGVKGGTPMILEHDMSYIDYSEYPVYAEVDPYEGKRKIYEMYSYMSKGNLLNLQNKGAKEKDYKEFVLTMSILMPAKEAEGTEGKKVEGYSEKLCFVEQIDELPFQEVHSEKIDGRWLGLGNVEKQLENQIARNTSANLRKRNMLWSSKKMFYTQGDAIGKNLVKNVQDGEILQVGLNGQISTIDTASRGLNDFTQDEQIWEDNGQKQSFAFESATGESMASGTPFRLGAMLSNSVMSYFDRQKEIFGLFLQDVYEEQLIPIFKARAKDDIAVIGSTEEGYSMLKDMFIDFNVNDFYAKLALDPNVFDYNIPPHEEIVAKITKDIVKSPYLYPSLTKDLYKNAKYTINLNITGEAIDAADKETLTTLWTGYMQVGDKEKADRLLDVILGANGKNLGAILGSAGGSKPAPQQQSPAQQNTNPQLAGLLPQQA